MRAWATGEVGTDTLLTVPLDPPYPVDPETLIEQTTVDVWDWKRPEHDTSSGCKFPVESRNPQNPQWVVIDFDATAAPAGTFDLGDPSDPDWQTTALTAPEKNFLTQQYPDDPVIAACETRGDVLRAFKPEGFRGTRGSTDVVEWEGG